MTVCRFREVRVWDLPVRLFHWCLPVALVVLFVSADGDAMELHALAGQAVLALVLFRLAWGFVGSRTARFSDFVVGPRGIADYLAGGRPRSLGHNPLGALMVLALLAFLLVLAVSGMFADDGIFYAGPLAHRIGAAAAVRLAEFHGVAAYVLLGFVAVHALAVPWHWLRHGENPIAPMLSGNKLVADDVPSPRLAGPARALGVLAAALGVVAFLSGGP